MQIWLDGAFCHNFEGRIQVQRAWHLMCPCFLLATHSRPRSNLLPCFCLALCHSQDCYHNGWGVIPNQCTHARDVGVICGVTSVPVRLVGGPSNKWGRLEVQVAGQWGTVSDQCRPAHSTCATCSPLASWVLQLACAALCLALLQICTDGISEVRRDELAQAVCRQLKYSAVNARVIGNALYGKVRTCWCEPGCG